MESLFLTHNIFVFTRGRVITVSSLDHGHSKRRIVFTDATQNWCLLLRPAHTEWFTFKAGRPIMN